jgi:predicted metal-dependent phosphotriesterase family hydrolase
MPSIMTVTGPLDASAAGIVLPHEHVFCDIWRPFGREGVLHDVGLAVQEVTPLAELGVGVLVDLSTDEVGRNPEGLRRVSTESGIPIVMGAGHYREPYLDREHIDRMSVNQLADQIVRDIELGVGDSGIRPGVIGEVASEYDRITAVEERCIRAAARAQLRTGLSLTTHAAVYPSGIPQLEIFASEGVDLGRVVIGHCDTVPDMEYHLEIARRGAFVQFDTIRGNREFDLAVRLQYMKNLANEGFLDRILISQDICLRSHLKAYGGSGYTYLPGEFLELLRDAGFTQAEIDQMTRVNPVAALFN